MHLWCVSKTNPVAFFFQKHFFPLFIQRKKRSFHLKQEKNKNKLIILIIITTIINHSEDKYDNFLFFKSFFNLFFSFFLYDDIGRGQLNMQLNKSDDGCENDDGGEEGEEEEEDRGVTDYGACLAGAQMVFRYFLIFEPITEGKDRGRGLGHDTDMGGVAS